eukprot:1941533-Pyramimonas_sp.AAC.1
MLSRSIRLRDNWNNCKKTQIQTRLCLHPSSTLPTIATADEGIVCKYLASVFDPEASDHLARLRRLAPKDREVVLARLSRLVSTLSSEKCLELVKLLPEGLDAVPELVASSHLTAYNTINN